MDELKKRKTTRLKGADYNQNLAVFLTICTKERRCILSRIVGTGVLDGPQIELTKYGRIADKYIHQLNDFYDDISVESYVIMPNHIHIMLWIKGAKKYFLQKFIESENCISLGFSEVEKEKAEEYKNILTPFVKNTNLRGY